MKKLFILLLIMTMIMPVIPAESEESNRGNSFGTFSGADKINAQLALNPGSWPFFSKLYYLPSTLPKEIIAAEISEPIRLDSLDGTKKNVIPEACSVEFVSGSESLRNAVEIEQANGTSGFRFVLSPEKLTETGSASFRVRAEMKDLYYEKVMSICVISWETFPLFNLNSQDMHISVLQGEGEITEEGEERVRYFSDNTNLYSDKQLVSMVLSDRTEEVVWACLNEDQRNEISRASVNADEIYALRPGSMSSGQSNPEDGLWAGELAGVPFRYSSASGYQFRKSGDYHFYLCAGQSNLVIPSLQFDALPYSIQGPAILQPGMQGTFTVQDADRESGRTFTLGAEGEGFSFDSVSGTISISEDAPNGTAYTITASPSDLHPVVRMTGTVSSGLLDYDAIESGLLFESEEMSKGFRVPHMTGTREYHFWQNRTLTNGDVECFSGTDDETAPYVIEVEYRIKRLETFAEDPAEAEKTYTEQAVYDNARDILTETISLDGHPARLFVMKVNGENGPFSCGEIYYTRNDRMLNIEVSCLPQNGTEWERLPRISMDDMRNLAEHIEYDPSTAPVTVADGEFSLFTAEGGSELSGGQKLTVQAVFANQEKVSNEHKDALTWTISGPNGSKAPEGLSVNQSGILSAERNIRELIHAEVRAESPVFHTSAVFPVTVYPAAVSLSLDPDELFFYTGTISPAVVRPVLEPKDAKAQEISWHPAQDGLLKITVNEDGSAEITPINACRTIITVTESGGRTAILPVSVIDPVTAVSINAKDRAPVGGKFWAEAVLEPRRPENMAVEWSLNVDDSVATISNKGLISISKNAPKGTVITVTCKALGAPEPLVATLDIMIE